MPFQYAGFFGPALVTNLAGDAQAATDVTVRNPDTSLAALYSDKDRTTAVANPVTTDTRGQFDFYAEPGPKTITANGITRDIVVDPHPDEGDFDLSAHVGAADPHPGYLTSAEGNAAYEPAGAVAAHAADTTAVHGIADTSVLETVSGAQAKVDAAVAALIDSSPAALDTLNELAAALGDDANFAASVTAALAAKADTASTVMDGDAAAGVLSGTYPNPGFAVDMATQAELDAAAAAAAPLTHTHDAAYVEQDTLVYNVRDYGATGDGVADDTAEIQAAIDAAELVNGEVLLPRGTYLVSSALTIQSPSRVTGSGAVVTRTATGGGALAVTSSDVIVRGIRFDGPRSNAIDGNETAVNITGASAAARVERVVVRDCEFTEWTKAVQATFVRDLSVLDNLVETVSYAGITLSSVSLFRVAGNVVDTVTMPSGTLSYGIVVTQDSTGPSATFPVSSDGVVADNLVRSVPWEGIDTHSGQRITIRSNEVYACGAGIVVTATEGSPERGAPLDIAVVGNVVDWGATSGSTRAGIIFAGADAAVPTDPAAEYATGAVVGNVVRNHGQDTDQRSGGITLRSTRGVSVTGGAIIECVRNGIAVTQNNDGFLISGVTVTDAWTNAVSICCGVRVTDNRNSGYIGAIGVVRGARTATGVNAHAVRVDSSTDNLIRFGSVDADVTGTVILFNSGTNGEYRVNAPKIGFYGVTPVVRPAAYTQTYATTTRTLGPYTSDPESTAYTAPTLLSESAKLTDLNALRVAYENLRGFVEQLAGVVNSMVDDRQLDGLAQ